MELAEEVVRPPRSNPHDMHMRDPNALAASLRRRAPLTSGLSYPLGRGAIIVPLSLRSGTNPFQPGGSPHHRGAAVQPSVV